MFSVAVIGPDGAGKTTLTRRLESSNLLPFRYLYMGVAISSSNAALPTSLLWNRLKEQRRHNGPAARAEPSSCRRLQYNPRHAIRATARLANRLAEEWFRQLISRYYLLCGFVVLYDRHFVFDFAPEISVGGSLHDRFHRWYLARCYPRPDLVLFLDAPGEILFARKGESTVEELERRRQAFLRQGKRISNFIRVDATRPLEQVYGDLCNHIIQFAASKTHRVVGFTAALAPSVEKKEKAVPEGK